jgi:hypothetical protein
MYLARPFDMLNFSPLRRRVVLSFCGLAATMVACGSETTNGEGTATDDVVTSRCPASITFELDKPFVFRETPSKQFDGTPLSSSEKERTKTAMDRARGQAATSTTLGNLVKRSGTCTYSAGFGERAVLRTKDGKDRLDITKGDFRVFAFPESFDKNGIVFGPRSVVNYFANVRASGPGDATLNIRIGKVRVSSPKGRAPDATTIRVPILDESGALVNDSDASFPKTIELDDRTGPDKYSALTDQISEKGIEPMRFAGPDDYVTKDPSTSICFKGDERDVCGLLTAFTDNLLSDMFGIAGDEDDESGCVVTKNKVSLEFFMSESDSTSSAEIPRCK